MLERKQFTAMASALLCAIALGTPASAEDVVTEPRKLINVIGVNARIGFGYVTLFDRDTTGCGLHGLMTIGMATEEERLVFSTLLAAKTASRVVTVSFDRDRGCAVTSAHIH